MYEVWRARRGRASRGPRFRFLKDALRYVHERRDDCSYALRRPDGSWHHFETTGDVTHRARRTSGVAPVPTDVVVEELSKKAVNHS